MLPDHAYEFAIMQDGILISLLGSLGLSQSNAADTQAQRLTPPDVMGDGGSSLTPDHGRDEVMSNHRGFQILPIVSFDGGPKKTRIVYNV